MSVRSEILESTSRSIKADLRAWGVSQRKAAKQLGLAISTFNSLLNCEYNTQHDKTLEKLLSGAIWSETTKQQLQTLLNYESLAFRGDLHAAPKRTSLRVLEGGKGK